MHTPDQTNYDRERLVRRLDELSAAVDALQGELDRSHRLATLGMLAGSIAHEFNNILTPVLSYAQMAMASPNDHQFAQRALQKAAMGVERASEIASAMLGLARMSDSDQDSDVRQSVDATFHCLGRDLGKQGMSVQIEVAAGLRARIRPGALQQVLLNLVLNAIEAMGGSIGRLEVHAERATWNAEQVVIEVRDTGRGISPEFLGRVFEPFVTDRRDPNAGPGTGLGLSISKRLIEDAGGRIEVESVLGEGTTFRVILPNAAAASQQGASGLAA